MHVFCDASQDAYAAVVYLRSENENGVKVQLVFAKSRVSPLKKPTIPRLELMACLIGTRLALAVKVALSLEKTTTVYWSDSTTALAWISRNDNWGSFVGNRVRDILKLSEAKEWRHVPGVINPADLPSRGCSPRKLLESKWWEGPAWLYASEEEWPKIQEGIDEEAISMEKRKTEASNLATTVKTDTIPQPRFSTYQKNVAVMAWVRRFIYNIGTNKEDRVSTTFLTIVEIRKAEIDILKKIQDESFPEDLQEISGIPVKRREDRLLHVKTKLLYKDDTEEFRWPILLPKQHTLVDQLIMDVHLMHGHAETQFLMGYLREKYWILQGRRTIRRVIKKWAKCRRYDSKNLTVDPAALPEKRVTPGEPFQTTGVDLAGPLYLRDGSKVWIVLFTCAVYRAVHLDLVATLSTEGFLDSLERFISLYGRPNTVYSDNGTNFVGAVNLFKKLDWKRIEGASQVKKIQWIFNPPTAAWWGGFWERLVRSVKDLLRRMLGRARLTYDQLRTCLASTASVINNRPLTTVTADPNDLVPLTPAMFLRGSSRNYSFPEALEFRSCEMQAKYKKTRKQIKELGDRFRKEYLGLLVHRGKMFKHQELKVGDIVLVGADNKKRFEWPLGRIIGMKPGGDGIERVAIVRTVKTDLTRPLQRLYPLEIHSPEDVPLIPEVAPKDSCVYNDLVDTCNDQLNVENNVEVKTRSGRTINKPSKYGEWNN